MGRCLQMSALLLKDVYPVRAPMTELSLCQHLQQDDSVEEEPAMRSVIMHRFLRAAKEVAAEHERTIPSIHHMCKSRTKQSMAYSVSGFFCQVLKSALFCTRRTVHRASGRATSSNKSCASHLPNHVKVPNGGTSLISSEMEGPVARKKKKLGGMTKHQSVINIDVPVLHRSKSPDSAEIKESQWRRWMKCRAGSCRRGSVSSINAGWKCALSESANASLASCNHFDNIKSKQSPYEDNVGARKFTSMALKEQVTEIVQEGVATCNPKRTCEYRSTSVNDHVKNLPTDELEGKNMMSSSTLQDGMGRLETSDGKPVHGNGDHDKDDEPQFSDALSRPNLGEAEGTFYAFGSPKHECEVVELDDERINNEMDFIEASSHFQTSHTSMSENNSVSWHVCTTKEMGMSRKMSKLSRRVGKDLKLEIEKKQANSLAKSPSKHDLCSYELKHECRQAELQTKRFSRLRHRSLDSISGLYPSKASVIFPVLPAKCQNSTPDALGWPFGISSYHSSREGGSPYDIQQKQKNIEKHGVGGNVPSPPLPPAPTESWLGYAITKNASKTTVLASLQQKEKMALDRRRPKCLSANLDTEWKLDIQAMIVDADRSWEDVVKGSQVHSGNLRYSEELQILMRTST